MVSVNIVRQADGRVIEYRVTGHFPNAGAAAAAVSALENIVPDAYSPQMEDQLSAAESDGELNVACGSVTEV